MDTPSDLERSRLLLVWLQTRRAVDRCLSDLLAAGPAGERRVREQLELVDNLESRAQEAFVQYRAAVMQASPDLQDPNLQDPNLQGMVGVADWTVPADPAQRPRLGVVRTGQHGAGPASSPSPAPGPGPGRDTIASTVPNATAGPGPAPGSGAELASPASGSTTGAQPSRDPARSQPPAGTSPPTGPPTGPLTGCPSPTAPSPSAFPSSSLPSASLPSARVIPLTGRNGETDITGRPRAIRGSQRRHR